MLALSAAFAQSSSQTTGSAGPAAPSSPTTQTNDIALDTVTVTPTRTAESLTSTLAAASVVTPEEIVRVQATRVSDLFRSVPGVTTQESPNDPGQAINIRGLQDFGRVNVLVDGARQDFQISGHNANGTFYLDPEFIGSADVVRGPAANIYGSGAIGGVVAFNTRGIDDILDPDERYGVVETIGAGTNGAGFLTSTAAGVRFLDTADLYGQFVYRNKAAYEDGSGTRVRDTGSDIVGGLLKARVRPSEGQELTASAFVQDFDFTNNGTSGAGTRFKTDVQAETYTLGYTFRHPDNDWIDFGIKAYYTRTRENQKVEVPTTTYEALGVVPGDELSDDLDTLGVDVHNTSRFTTGAIDHALTLGGDAAWDHVETDDEAGGYVSALTPSGRRTLAGAFLQDEARYRWLRVLGALRYDHYDLDGGGYSSSGDHLSPKITVGVSPVTGFEVYGTYAEGYRAPSITETLIAGAHPFPAFTIYPNPDLDPEVGHNIEAGVNLDYDNVVRTGDRFRAKAAVFRNRVDDYIDFVTNGSGPVIFIPGLPNSFCAFIPSACAVLDNYQYQNVTEATLSGVEFEGGYDWQRGFVTVAASHVDGKNEDTGGPLNSTPPDRIATTLGLRFLDDKLTVGTRWTLVDASEDDVSAPSKGYGLVDVFASYRYNDRVAANVAVDNILDRTYTPFLYTEANPGVTAKFSLTVKFASK